MRFQRLSRLFTTVLFVVTTGGGLLLGLSLTTSTPAYAASGDCLLSGGGASGPYAGDEGQVAFGMHGDGGTCTVTPSDTVTVTLPAGLTLPGSAFPSSYDDGEWTCSWAGGSLQTTATCHPDQTLGIADGAVAGIFVPFVASTTASGTYTVNATGPGGPATQNLTISSCAAPSPLLDPRVAGESLGAAGVVALGVVLFRRRRARRAPSAA